MKTKYFKYVLLFVAAIFVISSGCSETVNISDNIKVYGISPNPLDKYGILDFELENEMTVTIKIADAYGRDAVIILDNKILTPNKYSCIINMTNQPAGVYCCIIKVSGEIFITKFSKY